MSQSIIAKLEPVSVCAIIEYSRMLFPSMSAESIVLAYNESLRVWVLIRKYCLHWRHLNHFPSLLLDLTLKAAREKIRWLLKLRPTLIFPNL